MDSEEFGPIIGLAVPAAIAIAVVAYSWKRAGRTTNVLRHFAQEAGWQQIRRGGWMWGSLKGVWNRYPVRAKVSEGEAPVLHTCIDVRSGAPRTSIFLKQSAPSVGSLGVNLPEELGVETRNPQMLQPLFADADLTERVRKFVRSGWIEIGERGVKVVRVWRRGYEVDMRLIARDAPDDPDDWLRAQLSEEEAAEVASWGKESEQGATVPPPEMTLEEAAAIVAEWEREEATFEVPPPLIVAARRDWDLATRLATRLSMYTMG